MRDTLIILSICVLALAIGAAVYFNSPSIVPMPETPAPGANDTASVSAAADTAPVDVAFAAIGQGSRAQEIDRRTNMAVFAPEDFADLWRKAGNAGAAPAVDFSEYYVIGVFAGTQSSGGVAISVEKVTDENGTRTLSILTEKPGAGCVTTQALTSPYQFIRVPLSDDELAHTDTEREVPCGS